MNEEVQTMVGKTVERVECYGDDFGGEKGFTIYFTDGSSMEVGSRPDHTIGGSFVTVWSR